MGGAARDPSRALRTGPTGDDPAIVTAKRAAASALVARAESTFGDGQNVATAELLERAVGLDPTFPESYLLLARVHLQRDDEELALAFLDRAQQLAAGDPRVLGEIESLRGSALEGSGRRDAALAAYERALRLAPDNVRARTGVARLTGPRALPD
jgi:tetratricopeptide (TPR) repeat protein